MKKTYLILFVSFITNFINAQTIKNEPRDTYEIIINDKSYKIKEGESILVDTIFHKSKIYLKKSKSKIFKTDSLEFSYPSSFVFEFEEDFGYKNWTLSGNNVVIMYFELDVLVNASEMADKFAQKFGLKNTKKESVVYKLGQKNLNGVKLNVTLIGQNISQLILNYKCNDKKSRLIIIQDSLDETKMNSKEFVSTIEEINNSIKYN